MLRVWKRSWKEKDPSSDCQQTTLDGPSGSVSSLDSTAGAHPSDAITALTGDSALKRRRSDASMPDASSRRKRVRFDTPLSNLKKDLQEQARQKNTVVVLRPEQSTIQTLAELITSLVAVEKSRLSPTVKKHRTTLIVINDVSSYDAYSKIFCALASHLSVGLYNKNAGAEPWGHLLLKDITIVTTELLLESLGCGQLAMTQLQMMIFASLGDSIAPFQQVMESFYLVTDPLSRPRIVGFLDTLAALSVISKLEGNMDCRVLHISDYELDDRQQEVVVFYEKTTSGFTSTLVNKLLSLNSNDDWFLLHLDDSMAVLDEVGTCASDLLWRRTLKESGDISSDEGNIGNDISTREQIRLRIKNWNFSLPNIDPTSFHFNVTHKFMMLVKVLESCEPYGEAFRGIILVKRRAAALVIADMLRMLDAPSLLFRPLYFAWDDVSPTQRQNNLRLFTIGVHNILIVPKLDTSVRTTNVSVIISFNKECLNFGENNGRAQTTIHMVQNNAETHETTQLSDRTPKTLTIERADNIGPSTVIRDPTTGNCLYTRDSVVAVERIASCGRLNGVLLDQVLFSFKKEEDASASGRSFRCCVTISGLVELTGPPRQTKLDAQSVACFIFCQHLASTGLLDCRFFPPPKSLDTARLGSGHQPSPKDPNSGGPRRYSRKEPEFWPNTRKFESASLYPIIISTPPDPDKQPYAPIVILTRQPLPDLASFNIFHSGIPAVVSIERGEPLPIDGAQLNDLYLYTLRICRTVSNKPFQCSQADMAYFFAPLTTTWTSSGQCDPASPLNLPSIVSHIPWDAVQLAGSSYNMPIKMDTLEDADRDVHDAVIQDRQVEFTRRYDAVKLRPDLSPLSKPKDSRREAAFENMLEFTKARRKGFEELKDVNQPLIEVITIPGVLNQLNPLSRPLPIAKSSHAKYLIPELSSKCTIPASALRTARLLPSITRRIDEFLLVKELNAKLFDHKISDVLLHMSLCTPSSGAEYNYERLELLGDAFLKYMSSTYLFVTHPAHKEGSLHDERQGLISNKSLYRCADRAGVPNYIQSKLFSPRVWAPPFFTVPAPVNKANDDAAVDQVEYVTEQNAEKKKKKRRKRGSDEGAQWLGDKARHCTAIADVAEAILAAGYLTGGRETALQVAKALGIPILGVNTWSDFAAKGIVAPLNLNLKQDSIEPVESIIGYKVKQPQLLSQALTHFSIVGHDSTFTERLEFVGDAILDFMVIRHLYEKEQQLTPGGLTLLKAAMVSNSTLAAVCVCSGLYEHFCHKSHPLHTSIRDYVSRLEMCREKEYKDAESEGRPPGQFWLDITAPKALSDIVESVIGAVYVGDQFSSEGIETLYEKLLKPFYDKHISLKTLSHHPTTLLFELFQRQGCRQFAIKSDRKGSKGAMLAEVIVHDIMLASAEDRDPALVARRASLFALDALEGDPSFIARTCDCRIVQIPAGGSATEEKISFKQSGRLPR